MSTNYTSTETGSQVTTTGNIAMIIGGLTILGAGSMGTNATAGLSLGGAGGALIGTGLMLTGLGAVITRKGVGGDMYSRANIDSSGRILLGASLASIPFTLMITQDPSVLRIAIPVECAVGAVGAVLLGSAQDLGGLYSWDTKNQA